MHSTTSVLIESSPLLTPGDRSRVFHRMDRLPQPTDEHVATMMKPSTHQVTANMVCRPFLQILYMRPAELIGAHGPLVIPHRALHVTPPGVRGASHLLHPRPGLFKKLRLPAIRGQELQHDAIAPAKAGLHAVLALAARLSWPLRIQLLKLNNHGTFT